MIASGTCFDMGYERPVKVAAPLAGLSRARWASILGGNAASLLGLSSRLLSGRRPPSS